jgi:tRNA modification GTPase
MTAETIFALSSGPPPAGVAVLRLSGPDAGPALAALCGSGGLPDARRAALRRLSRPADGTLLDEALVLWFPAPDSFTGEDVAEIHAHGGAATIAALEAALAGHPGCRRAEPGEFSRRAFAAGKMDLTAAEGLADLIAAETEAQRRLALRLAGGAGLARVQGWSERLTRVLAVFEAAVDFPEDDLPETMLERNEIEIRSLIDEWSQDIEIGARAQGIRDGVRIAIVGPPNAGKSALLNRLAGREAAIVSETAGTTRDVIEVRMDLNGYAVTLADTAGLRETGDAIEAEGVRRARQAAEAADLILCLGDTAESVAATQAALPAARAADTMAVLSKADLRPAPADWNAEAGRFAVSSVTGAGLGALLEALGAACAARYGAAEAGMAVRARHRDALARARDALRAALEQPEAALAGEDIRAALTEMGRITGRVDVEAVLDVVFSEFCIGK